MKGIAKLILLSSITFGLCALSIPLIGELQEKRALLFMYPPFLSDSVVMTRVERIWEAALLAFIGMVSLGNSYGIRKKIPAPVVIMLLTLLSGVSLTILGFSSVMPRYSRSQEVPPMSVPSSASFLRMGTRVKSNSQEALYLFTTKEKSSVILTFGKEGVQIQTAESPLSFDGTGYAVTFPEIITASIKKVASYLKDQWHKGFATFLLSVLSLAYFLVSLRVFLRIRSWPFINMVWAITVGGLWLIVIQPLCEPQFTRFMSEYSYGLLTPAQVQPFICIAGGLLCNLLDLLLYLATDKERRYD
ncbi:MAG: hypothetical protein N2Z76_03400 [Treponemataceae bacterium]|nr:hypothetical protein [Treponemataceae bacterium]